MRKLITTEIRNEVVAMTKEGHTTSEICKALGISKPSVYRAQKAAGLTSNNGNKGGVVARTIPDSELHKNVAKDPEPVKEQDDEPESSVIIADQSIAIAGIKTSTLYRAELNRDTITVDGSSVIGEVRIDQILDLAEELKSVYTLVTRMKGNRFELA
jgi:transposase-like protein